MLDRSVAPVFKKIDKIEVKQPQQTNLPNGLSLYSLKSGTQPVINLELIFEAGKWFERKNGVSLLTGGMLTEGTKSHSASRIAQIFETQGAQIQVAPGPDYLSISVYSLSKNFSKIISLVKEIIVEASFPSKELEILKNIHIQNVKVNKEKTSFLAQRDFMRVLFGKTHPYGRITDEEHLQDVERKDVLGFYKDVIERRPFVIFASGQFDEGLVALISETFETLKIRDPIDSEGRNPTKSLEDITIIKEDAVQSSIRMGGQTIPLGHPDYQKLLVANEIIGGYFGSRLMKNIREKKGYTYGIYSYLGRMRFGSYFAIASDVKKEFRKDALQEIIAELDTIIENPVSDKELDTVRNYMLGEFISGINTPFALMSKFKTLLLNKIDGNYYSQLFDTISGISSRDVQEMAVKYFKPDSMVKVVIG